MDWTRKWNKRDRSIRHLLSLPSSQQATMSAEKPLAPFIANQLAYLLSHSPLPIKVDQICSGCRSSRYSNYFTLSIPFCLDYIKWDFMYNTQYPSVPPDIVFSAGDEDFNPLVDIGNGGENGKERKSCLRDWDGKDPSKLLSLVHEIRGLYLEHQRRRVGKLNDERLKFETDTIFSRKGIEVCVISGPDRAEEVIFAVPLLDNMDLNKLVVGCPWRRQQQIYLQVAFPVSRGYSAAPNPRLGVVSSPDLKALIATEDIKLPVWVDGMCMAEYLPTFEDNLNVQVVEAVAAIGARRRFIEALAPSFGRPIEADSVFCRKASVLSTSGGFTFLVHFSIPTQFPRQQPAFILQSCQHWNPHGLPVSSPPIADYPWSPRWETSAMAERIFDFLIDESLRFKMHCTDVAPHPP